MVKFILALVALGSAVAASPGFDGSNPRPELPQCQCLKTWPHSDDPAMWFLSYGDGSQGSMWEVDAAVADGCTMVSSDWPESYGSARDAYQFCVPDTSNGPCIGLGGYSAHEMSFHMACGHQGEVGAVWSDPITADPTQPTPDMTADQKLAAMAYADAYAAASQLPACTCEADWSESKLAETYCGENKIYAQGDITKETCFDAPKIFDNTLTNASKGKFDWGYYREDQVPKQHNAITKWCKVPATGCAVAMGGTDVCTGERWMATHMMNMTSGESAPVPQAAKMPAIQYSYGVNGISTNRAREVLAKTTIDPSDQTTGFVFLGGAMYVPMTFFPENVNSFIGNEENKMEMAQAAAKATQDKYDKIDWVNDYILMCDEACKEEQAASAAEAKRINEEETAKEIKACDDDPECKAKQDSHCGEAPLTCGDMRKMYKASGCCGNPTKRFAMGRRLLGGGHDDLIERVKAALDQAKAKGPVEASKFAKAIKDVVKQHTQNFGKDPAEVALFEEKNRKTVQSATGAEPGLGTFSM